MLPENVTVPLAGVLEVYVNLSPSASLPTTCPFDWPVVLLAIGVVDRTVGTVLVGEMLIVTVAVVVPCRPSDTVTVKVSVVTDVVATVVAAACRAAAVGV